jgi:hypothetical protein
MAGRDVVQWLNCEFLVTAFEKSDIKHTYNHARYMGTQERGEVLADRNVVQFLWRLEVIHS